MVEYLGKLTFLELNIAFFQVWLQETKSIQRCFSDYILAGKINNEPQNEETESNTHGNLSKFGNWTAGHLLFPITVEYCNLLLTNYLAIPL